MRTEWIELPEFTPGVRRRIEVRRFGVAGARPKAYLQAALHADEIPPLLVAHCLSECLEAAEAANQVAGEVVLVPMANPVGLDQWVQGDLLGRTDLVSGSNFNRLYPDLSEAATRRLEGRLGDDAGQNTALIRAALLGALAELEPQDEAQHLRTALTALALDADIALDLHCDSDALLHVYLGTPLWPAAATLPAALESPVTLLAEVSGGNPFDEAVAGPWWALARHFDDFPIPPACLAATVEFRGERDVDLDLAETDAGNLMRFLAAEGVVAGQDSPPGDPPRPAAPLEGVGMARAPVSGVLVHDASPGDTVRAGDRLARVVSPQSGSTEAVTAVLSPVDGLVFARAGRAFVRRGQIVAKISGDQPIPGRQGGHLLSD